MVKQKGSKRTIPLARLKVYLSILESIRNHGKFPDLGLSDSVMEKYVCRLKKEGNIKRIGYGVWEVKREELYLKENTRGLLPTTTPPSVTNSDDVRLHNLMFIVRVDFLWKNVLEREGIDYKTLSSGVFRILVDGFRVWLCPGKVIIYVKPGVDFLAHNVSESLRLGLEWFYKFIERLQDVLRVHFRSADGLVWSVNRKHFSLVKNALAMQYHANGERLKVFDGRGLWLVTDRSFNVDELEFVRSSTNTGDTANIQKVMNCFKKNPLTSDEIMQMFQGSVAAHASISVVVKQLVDVVKGLGGVL